MPDLSDVSSDSFFDGDLNIDDNSVVDTDDGSQIDSNNANGVNAGNDVNNQTQDSVNADVHQPGFEKNFFGDDGELNLNEAMNFITTNLPQKVDVPDIVTPLRSPANSFQKPVTDPNAQDQEEWERKYNETQEKRKAHYEPYTKFWDYIKQAMEEGLQGPQLERRAFELAREAADESWNKLEFKRQHEDRLSEQKRINEERAYSELIPKSRTNLGLMYTRQYNGKALGEDGFNELVFGKDIKDDSGKVIGRSKGFGSDFINYAFHLQNPEDSIPKDSNSQEFKEFTDRWWIKFTSNPKNLEHMMDFALSKLHLHLRQYTASALKKKGVDEANRLRNASTGGKMSPKQKLPKGGEPNSSNDPFQNVLDGKDFVTDSV